VYQDATHDRFCQRLARQAMASALTDGTPEDIRLARAEVWRDVPQKARLLFALALGWPGAFAVINRVRRRRYNRRARQRAARRREELSRAVGQSPDTTAGGPATERGAAARA
jgi:hypothetical protein